MLIDDVIDGFSFFLIWPTYLICPPGSSLSVIVSAGEESHCNCNCFFVIQSYLATRIILFIESNQ